MTKSISRSSNLLSPQQVAFTQMSGNNLYVIAGVSWVPQVSCYMVAILLEENPQNNHSAPSRFEHLGAGDVFRSQTFALPSANNINSLVLNVDSNSLHLPPQSSPDDAPEELAFEDVSFDLRYHISWVSGDKCDTARNLSGTVPPPPITIDMPPVSQGGTCAQNATTLHITAYAFPKDDSGSWPAFDGGAKIPVFVGDPIVIVTPPGCGS